VKSKGYNKLQSDNLCVAISSVIWHRAWKNTQIYWLNCRQCISQTNSKIDALE